MRDSGPSLALLFDRRLSPDSSALLVSEPPLGGEVAILLTWFVDVVMIGLGDRLEATDISAPEFMLDCLEIREEETGGELQDELEEDDLDEGGDIGSTPLEDPPGTGDT